MLHFPRGTRQTNNKPDLLSDHPVKFPVSNPKPTIMQHFQFNIPRQYIYSHNDLGHYFGITYEVVDNRVVVIGVDIPFELLPLIINNSNLHSDIYAAAENNAISFDLIKMMA